MSITNPKTIQGMFKKHRYLEFNMYITLSSWILDLCHNYKKTVDYACKVIYSICRYVYKNNTHRSKFQLLGVAYMYLYDPNMRSYFSNDQDIINEKEKLPKYPFPEDYTSEDYRNLLIFLLNGEEDIDDFDKTKKYELIQYFSQEYIDSSKKIGEEYKNIEIEQINRLKNKPASLHNNYGNNENESFFDKLCKDFDLYKGAQLGKGSYGTAYDFKDLEKFFVDKDVVVKRIIDSNETDCSEKIVKTKKGDIKALYCQGQNLVLAEYYISIAASKLNSENFIKTYVYKSCDDSQFIFMEKVDATFRKFAENRVMEEYFDAILIQILHALWSLHKAGISHNDSKGDNIFLTKAENYVSKNGSRLQDYEYVEYDFGFKKIYIPVEDIKYVVKIGDFGLSQKYSEPAVLTDFIYEPWVISDVVPLYDIMLAFSEIKSHTSPLYKTIQTFILGFEESIDYVSGVFDRERIKDLWTNNIKCICDESCSIVEKTDKIILNSPQNEFENFLQKEVKDFIYCIFFNNRDEGVNRRQTFNFLLPKMKESGIDIEKIITTNFFNTQIQEYEWDDVDSDKILLFGGPN